MNWDCVSLLDLLVELALAPIWPNPSPNAVKDFFSLENTLFARFMMRAPIIRRSTNQPKPANYPTKVLNGATPHPAFGHPFPPGRRCRAAADEGETPVLPTPLTRPSATLSRRRGFLALLPPGEGAAQRRMRGKRRCFPRPSPESPNPPYFHAKKCLTALPLPGPPIVTSRRLPASFQCQGSWLLLASRTRIHRP